MKVKYIYVNLRNLEDADWLSSIMAVSRWDLLCYATPGWLKGKVDHSGGGTSDVSSTTEWKVYTRLTLLLILSQMLLLIELNW